MNPTEAEIEAAAYAISKAYDYDYTWESLARAALIAAQEVIWQQKIAEIPSGKGALNFKNAEVARLTRLLEDTRHELNAIREARRQESEARRQESEARRQEKLRIIDLALDLAKSKEPDHWAIASMLCGTLDKPAHADEIRQGAVSN